MMRRKHRLYIDVTYSTKQTRRDAAKGLQLFLDTNLDIAKQPVWAIDPVSYIDKLKIVESPYAQR
jgi:hypothetical protein